MVNGHKMATPLTFRGIAHPPAKSTRDHPSDLSVGELAVTNTNGLPLHVEHDTTKPPIGHVLASYEGTRGELRVIGQVTDPTIAAQVKSGELRGLSLGTDCVQDMSGNVLSRHQKELSLCDEGRRSGTWVTHINDRMVHSVAAFSAKGARRPAKPPLTITPFPHFHTDGRRDLRTMSDTMPIESTDSVTKQSYDEEKARATKASEENASLKARLEAFENRDRSKLQSYQPVMENYIKELATEFATPENKVHFDSFSEWTRSCHERPNLDTQMQLGTVIHACASKLKRTREDASVQSATADQLASMAKENEGLREKLTVKDARIGELSTSLKEIQENSEALQMQLRKADALSEKFDFSKATSREADAAKTDDEKPLVSKTENASKMGFVQTVDPSMALFAFVNGNFGGASARFMPSSSNHSLLGAPAGSDIGIGSALRPM